MAKPTSVPTWATDAGATSDPGATRKASGFITGKKAPAKWFNYLFNRAGQWFSYLDGLHNEPEFLNKAYAWTGAHSFRQGDLGARGEVLYVDATGTIVSKTRTTLHLLVGVKEDGSPGKAGMGAHGSVRLTSGDSLGGVVPSFSAPIDLPMGAVLTGWRMLAHALPKAGGTAIRGSVQLKRVTPDWSGLTSSFADIGPEVFTTGNITGEILPVTGLTAAIDATSRLRFHLKLTTADLDQWIDFGRGGYELTWLDPGPRNF